GRAKLLDFSAPGIDLSMMAQRPVPSLSHDASKLFLNEVAIAALEGRRADPAEASGCSAAVPVPIEARKVLDELSSSALDEVPLERWRALVKQPAKISRRRRLAAVAACCAPPLLMVALTAAGFWIVSGFVQAEPETWQLFVNWSQLKAMMDEKHSWLKGDD